MTEMSEQKIPRRSFIQKTSALTALAGLSIAGCAGSPERLGTKRIPLKEPGPMIPPVPAILLTVKGMPNDPDEISVVWTFVVNGNPPQIGIAVGDEHIARDLVKLHGEFVLNVPTVEIMTPFDTVDMNSGKVADKFKLSGLTRGKALAVGAPTVEESPIHVECRVTHTLRVEPMRTVYIADVVATTALEGACDANGRLIVENVPFFGMTAGSGEFYTMGRPVGHIGKSVGRNDIKY